MYILIPVYFLPYSVFQFVPIYLCRTYIYTYFFGIPGLSYHIRSRNHNFCRYAAFIKTRSSELSFFDLCRFKTFF